MRSNGFLISMTLMALAIPATPGAAATFGNVVAIGGQASDIALDETRGQLYIANFTANRIDVMTLADGTIHTSINVAPHPGSIALSYDAQYLLVAHFGNTNPPVPSQNLLTLVHLPDNNQQTFITTDPPLGVAFFATVPVNGPSNLTGPGKALVVTTTSFFLLDPTSATLQLLSTLSDVANAIPVTVPTFPGQILQTALSVSSDHTVVWGIGGAGTGSQIIYQYHAQTGQFTAFTDTSSPPLLPRISVSGDGSNAMIGWVMFTSNAIVQSKFPNVVTSTNVTGHAIDSKNGIIYAQIPDATQPSGPPYTSSSSTTTTGTTSVGLPTLLIMDTDNLTVHSKIKMPENIVGRMILNAAGTSLYAISDSGVMVLPIGTLNQAHRVVSDHEDILAQTTFCNRNVVSQSFVLSDPGGNHTDFAISSAQPGVIISPSSGTTPATITVTVDPGQFLTEGTSAVPLTITSNSAVNVPPTVRLLVNNPDQNQRGTVIDVPGTLTDIMGDPVRNRFYIVRQDLNELLVFDGSSNQEITALRTNTTPTTMTISNDGNYLLVANDNSQYVTVFDLNALQAVQPVVLPPSHYGHSVASSNNALLVVALDDSSGTGVIDNVNLAARIGTALPSLNIFTNTPSPKSVLASSPNGRSILVAEPDGTVMLYSADANTFTVGRKDPITLQGAYAASSYDTYVIGNIVFDASLVPQGTLDATQGVTSGFFFTGQGGYRVTASGQSTAGVIQNLPALTGAQVSPVAMVEAPLLPGSTANFTRTLAPMPGSNTIIAMTTSGFTVLSANYAAATAPPAIAAITNAADGSGSVAPNGLISVYGSQMSATNIATAQIPLPTALGQSCLVVNGTPIPLLFVSGHQVNAQLPLNVGGNVTMSIHTPAGISNNYNFTVQGAAPAVFQTGTAGPETGLATIFRYDNGQLVTPTNPVHPNDTLVIYLTGMGATSPAVAAGQATPMNGYSTVTDMPTMTLGGMPLNVLWAGLVPGYVSGLYQINVTVPFGVAQGSSMPLVISQGGGSTTMNVRVVN